MILGLEPWQWIATAVLVLLAALVVRSRYRDVTDPDPQIPSVLTIIIAVVAILLVWIMPAAVASAPEAFR